VAPEGPRRAAVLGLDGVLVAHGSLPSDLGDSDDGYFLPPMHVFHHKSEDQAPIMTDGLFGALEVSATSIFELKRLTARAGPGRPRDRDGADDEPCVIWVDTDYEADAVRAADAAGGRGSRVNDAGAEGGQPAAFADGLDPQAGHKEFDLRLGG
jgi:hypothetical protein